MMKEMWFVWLFSRSYRAYIEYVLKRPHLQRAYSHDNSPS